MKHNSNPAVDVVAAVIRRGENYLICQRPLGTTHGGMWEFPGGKVHDGESLNSAIQRELLEELGLSEVCVGDEVYQGQEMGSEYLIRFIEVASKDEPTLLEHIRSEWVAAPGLLTFHLAPVDRLFAQFLCE